LGLELALLKDERKGFQKLGWKNCIEKGLGERGYLSKAENYGGPTRKRGFSHEGL